MSIHLTYQTRIFRYLSINDLIVLLSESFNINPFQENPFSTLLQIIYRLIFFFLLKEKLIRSISHLCVFISIVLSLLLSTKEYFKCSLISCTVVINASVKNRKRFFMKNYSRISIPPTANSFDCLNIFFHLPFHHNNQ